MTINILKLRSKWPSRSRRRNNRSGGTQRFVVSAILATAAAVGAGVGLGNLIWAHREAPPPIVIQLPAPAK